MIPRVKIMGNRFFGSIIPVALPGMAALIRVRRSTVNPASVITVLCIDYVVKPQIRHIHLGKSPIGIFLFQSYKCAPIAFGKLVNISITAGITLRGIGYHILLITSSGPFFYIRVFQVWKQIFFLPLNQLFIRIGKILPFNISFV